MAADRGRVRGREAVRVVDREPDQAREAAAEPGADRELVAVRAQALELDRDREAAADREAVPDPMDLVAEVVPGAEAAPVSEPGLDLAPGQVQDPVRGDLEVGREAVPAARAVGRAPLQEPAAAQQAPEPERVAPVLAPVLEAALEQERERGGGRGLMV